MASRSNSKQRSDAPGSRCLKPARRPPVHDRWPWLCLLLAATACGCVSVDSVAFDPKADPVIYLAASSPSVERSEEEYIAADGARLGYVAYRCLRPRAAIVYLHGIESHGGWFAAAGDQLAARGFDVFCLDRRGSGINRENRGFPSGHVDGYETLFSDIQAFVRPLRSRYSAVYLTGLSWGGKLALGYALTNPRDQDALVLITPGLVARVSPAWYEQVGIVCCTLLAPTRQFATPIEPEMFTTTPETLARIRNDPLRLSHASARFFMQSRRLDDLVDERIGENRLPIQLFLAGNDRIIDNEAVLEILNRGAQEDLQVVRYEEQTHSIQFDATERMVQAMMGFLGGQQAAR